MPTLLRFDRPGAGTQVKKLIEAVGVRLVVVDELSLGLLRADVVIECLKL